jgi:MerR family transcriptional regulator, copper efflux regulator
MQIGELAKRCGITTSKIRFFESQGVLPATPRGENGYRDYSMAAIETIHLLLRSQRLGFSITEIKRALPPGGLDALNCDQILSLLHRKRATVTLQIQELTALSTAINDSIREFEARKNLGAKANN